MAADTLLFVFGLFDTGALLFLTVYFVITLSDLECDYLNAQQCCSKLNFPSLVAVVGTYGGLRYTFILWILPELIAHCIMTAFLILGWHWILFLMNVPLAAWEIYKFVTIPSGNMGIYDPTEIHNRGMLKSHMKESMVKLGYYLVFFFIYLYCMIVSLLTKEANPPPFAGAVEDIEF